MSAQCTNAAKVIAAVPFGRDHELDAAIGRGGHSVPAPALVNHGPAIDLSPMKGVRLDPKARTAC